MLPTQATGSQPSSTAAAGQSVATALTLRVRGECPGCGADSPGDELCGACAGWPVCEAGCGRRLRDGGSCESCQMAAHHVAIAAEAGEDGRCPGHGGRVCGRPVVNLGLCARCRIEADRERVARDAQWQQSVAAAVTAAEAAQPVNEPAQAAT
ncbi:hypothetical protein ABZ922_45225 [Streptomyces shenzhenensis]|uniref:hypothetical protein n=1 Tax=Streptomyces shenzhenensis TaxID=943815 RepID=UPI0033EEF09C